MLLVLKDAYPAMPTVEALKCLVLENSEISAIFTFTYLHPKLLQQRIVPTADEERILARALVLRSEARLPFWESLLLSCFGESRDYSRLLREAQFHQSNANSLLRISRDDVIAGRLDEMANAQPAGYHLSLSSKIELTGGAIRQLALLDFHCPENAVNDRLVAEVCKLLLKYTSLVFSSGESYHMLGLCLLDERAFREFLTNSLLFSPIVDARYVAHQLLEGSCALRLSSSLQKPIRPWMKFIVGMSSNIEPSIS